MLTVRNFCEGDGTAIVALWRQCGLLRPWNDPAADIARCLATPTSELFVGAEGRGDPGAAPLCAALMAGFDGHRGWLYYLAVAAERRGRGYGRAMVRHAEDWLVSRGAPKVELMIRANNDEVAGFYAAAGYAREERVVMARWLHADG